MSSIINDLKHSFRQGDNLIKLIYVNLALFIVVLIFDTFVFLTTKTGVSIDEWLAVPANLGELAFKPWTLITYMFFHTQPFHILGNLVMLYFGGRLFLEFLGERRLLTVYFLGGISGALLYIIFYNVFPVYAKDLMGSSALGASASVLAIVIAIASYIPNFSVRLFFLIEIKLKYIAMALIILDLASISGSNSGGHIAHLGGAAFGYYFIKRYQGGKDMSQWFYSWMSAIGSLFKSTKKSKMKVAYKNSSSSVKGNKKPGPDQNNVDRILDKISKSGYDSLTKEEKDILFKASKN